MFFKWWVGTNEYLFDLLIFITAKIFQLEIRLREVLNPFTTQSLFKTE